MKILAVSDIESRYYYEYYSPGKLDGFDLILACGDLSRIIWNFWRPSPTVRSYTFMEITMIPWRKIPRAAAFVSKIGSMSTRGSVFWAWAAPTVTEREIICLQSSRCAAGSGACS